MDSTIGWDADGLELVLADLISPAYRRLNLELHRRDAKFGRTAALYVGSVRRLAAGLKAKSILDYGCGKQELSKALHGEFIVYDFDPAISGHDGIPEPADLVVCIDVLEHIETDRLDVVLADLWRCTRRLLFVTIATRPAQKALADGSNCHRIVENKDWWLNRLSDRFVICDVECNPSNHGFWAVAAPRETELRK